MLAKLKPWISIILLATLAALSLSGRVEGPVAVGIAAGLEAALAVWVLWGLFRSVRGFTAQEGDPWKGLEDGLSGLVPRPAAKLMIMEIRLWACLSAWIRRRPPGRDDFPYHANSQLGLIMGVLVFTTPVEIAVLEILIPWPWLRIVTLILALYGMLWIVMLFASLRAMPHRLEPYGLRLHYGVLASGVIPFSMIASVEVALAKAPKSGDGLQIAGEEAFFAINGETNLMVTLAQPLALERVIGQTPSVTVIRFRSDEPKRMIERLRAALQPLEAKSTVPAQP